MSKFRDVKTLQKFASIHASIYNHFNFDRHLNGRETFKQNRSAAVAENKNYGPKIVFKFFGIGKKDANGRQVRVEHRGRFLRISRTGLVAIRHSVKVGCVNLTVNTRRGFRASTKIAKGTHVALQNWSFRLIGRYGKGPANINLSKSGVSASYKNKLGSFNFFKPNYSSFKFAGIQLRGKNAAHLQIIYIIICGLNLIIQLFVYVLKKIICFPVRIIFYFIK